MNKEIRNFITEFETIYNGEPWYGKSLMAVLATADPAKVYRKANNMTHSTYEITQHLYAWRDLLVKRLNGDKKSTIGIDSREDWTPLPAQQTPANWQALLKKLEENQEGLVLALGKWKDEDLDIDFAGTGHPLRTFLNGQIQHDIYHIGQIALTIKNES